MSERKGVKAAAFWTGIHLSEFRGSKKKKPSDSRSEPMDLIHGTEMAELQTN
jgi:hypothetical protein